MALGFKMGASGESGAKVYVDGVKTNAKEVKILTVLPDFRTSVNLNYNRSTLPYSFSGGSAVVYNNEIHILGGGYSSSTYTYHYKWNGSSWSSSTSLPYSFYYGSAVVYNNEIHILGSDYSSSYYTRHRKWNGSSWTSVSTLPYNFREGSAVVYNNEIHILGSYDSSYRTSHYKWNGSSWTSVSTLPYSIYNGSAVVLNNGIHILGGGSGVGTKHYLISMIIDKLVESIT